MANLFFNQSVALSLYQSENEFPIDLDDAWQWLGYSRKDKCLEAIQINLMPDLDFSTARGKSTGGRPKQDIRLSIEGFKMLGMIAGTEQGKIIRKYFLECERIAKGVLAHPAPQLPPVLSSKLTELTNEQARIRKVIAELRTLLSNEEHKLREIDKALIDEAKAFQKANHELMKQSLLVQEILQRASKDNLFDRSVSLK